MPKRKRNDRAGHGSRAGDNGFDDRINKFGKRFEHGKKRLAHALKVAKRYERQRLLKRISRAKQNGRPAEFLRLEHELEALKTLNLPTAAEAHLHKTLLKSKDIATSPGIQDYLSKSVLAPEPSSNDATIIAETNVVARLYNYKHLKSELLYVLDSIRNSLGIEILKDISGSSISGTIPPGNTEDDIASGVHIRTQEPAESIDSEWEGFSTSRAQGLQETEDELSNSQSKDDGGQRPLPEHDNSGSSPPARTDGKQTSVWDEIASVKASHNPVLEMPLSPRFGSPLPPSPPQVRGGKKLPTASNSTFLPSLMMSGYWSGSESAEDDFDELQPRKNRRGQRARRQIWEKKYGRNANHLRNQATDDNRAARKGTMGHKGTGTHSNRDGGSRVPLRQNKHQKVRHDANPTPSRNKAGSQMDQTKDLPLHPSWEAARKAKEQKQSAAFQGKKIVFD